ncbi:hypothetical protein [Bosea sp. (in: a-proteobacteria)]|uniref:hypothetical protein n=1 Tax=Bosea sp. (in: a-proteobacteria) TaxID=1871050 RepID=UPI002736C4F8|nr:hypothetical protein [Bosea sp. (in: a-proteobacteria)]MDP3406683.1 hypothetical protein [Bosea sp. (in: a-proteobacteria)]
MSDASSDHGHGFLGFNVFRRENDRELLLAVPLISPLPIILGSGWQFCHTIEMRESLPAGFDIMAAQEAIKRDGFYVFERGRLRNRALFINSAL